MLVLGIQKNDVLDFPDFFMRQIWKSENRNFSGNRNFQVAGPGRVAGDAARARSQTAAS